MKGLPWKHTVVFEIENLRVLITTLTDLRYNEYTGSPVHSHTTYEVHFLSAGQSHITSNKTKLSINPGEVCIVPPNTIHTWTSDVTPATKTSFCFRYERIKKSNGDDLFKAFDRAFSQIKDIRKTENAGKHLHEIERILSVSEQKSAYSPLKLRLLFSLLMLQLAEELTENDPSVSYEGNQNPDVPEKNLRQAQIEDYMNKNYQKAITLESLSNYLFLSKKQTERIFIKEMKMTFKTFLTKIRLEAAMQLLKETDLPAAEIAQRVGYRSYNGFYRMFQAKIGITPQDFRSRYK